MKRQTPSFSLWASQSLANTLLDYLRTASTVMSSQIPTDIGPRILGGMFIGALLDHIMVLFLWFMQKSREVFTIGALSSHS